MILITNNVDTIDLITASAVSTDWSVSYTDITTSAFTPGSAQGNVASATQTGIVSSPAASTQRQVKSITVRNRHATSTQTVSIIKLVFSGGANIYLTPDISLLPGETLTYFEGAGFHVLDSVGSKKHKRRRIAPQPFINTPIAFVPNSAASASAITTTTFVTCMGKAPRSGITSVSMVYRITTAATTITWAEVALYKGPISFRQGMTIVPIGYADVSGVVNSTGIKNTTINVSSGQVLEEGDDVWLGIGHVATGSLSMRTCGLFEEGDGIIGGALSGGVRPSLNIGQGLIFSVGSAMLWFVIGY